MFLGVRGLKFFQAAAIILFCAGPKQGGVVADTIEIGGRFCLGAKGRNGFPDGDQDFLKQIFSIGAAGEAVDDAVENRTVIARPFRKSFLLFGGIHWFLDIYEAADGDFLQRN